MKLMERKLKEMVTDADMERLQAVAEPLTDMFDEIEGDGSECYITWNFGYNKYGEITCGFDVRMHPRYRDDEQKTEEIKARVDEALELCGFELDSDIKHANPNENPFGGWHYQIKKIDNADADVELTADDMNAGQWYESLDKKHVNQPDYVPNFLEEDLGDLFGRIHDEDEYNWNLHDCDYTKFYDELKQYMKPGETWDAVDDMGWNADTNVDPVTLFRRMPKDKQIDFMNRFYIKKDFSGFFSDYDLED